MTKIERNLTRPVFFILKDIWSNLTLKRKLQSFLVFCLMIFSAICEIASLGTIYPFLDYLENENQELLIFKYLNIDNSQNMLVYLTISLIVIILLAGFLRIITLYYNYQLSAFIGNDISCGFYDRVINQRYIDYLYSNSNVIINSSTDGINNATAFIFFTLQFLTSLLISLCIFTTLVLINWKIAFLLFFVFSIVYLVLSLVSRKTISNNSKSIVFSREKHIQVVQEGLGSMREIIMNQQQNVYFDKYKKHDFNLRIKQAQNNTLAAFPRYALESFGISFIVLLAFFQISVNQENTTLIPLLGSIAFASQRLLPGIQTCYASVSGMRSGSANVEKVLNLYKNNKFKEKINSKTLNNFNFKKVLFKNVSFQYKNKSKTVLESIDFKINQGDIIGIIGTTGSGKSTFLDILMGLLKPTRGEILIDNEQLYKKNYFKTILSWRSIISHVPQELFLLDDSFLSNIAFGVPKKEIDYDWVKECAKLAQINDYIINTKYGYQTIIGERGIQLSGGQKQRIGIARAFYRKSKVLILDEATSALDQKTESKIIKSIHDFEMPITLIMVAHRLSSLNRCDRIYKLEDKKFLEIDKFNIIK